MASNKSLVIVESPAKARTIAGFLGDRYIVESSIGHVRDLPKSAKDIPSKYKEVTWARLGVDVQNDFTPLYIVDPDKKSHISKLKKLLKETDELLLATDEDREGESIAWHLLQVLQPRVPVKRMVFHEITKPAIERAIAAPRDIDRHLVDAQEARRILDRLYGYEVSPVLWKKVLPKLSAGRVQSVATRIIVERERARIRFRPATWWDVEGELATRSDETFRADLVEVDGWRLATGKDFDEQGRLTRSDALLLEEAPARSLADELLRTSFTVESVERKPYKRSPAAPFMTSTLQQEAGRKLGFGARRAMQAAQRLYENGYITYMRTDSTTLSDAALDASRKHIRALYGDAYVPKQPRLYRKKVKNAQEAHEAIRPAGDAFRKPEDVAREVGPDEARLYELVWKRTVASQMEDARGESLQVRIVGTTPSGQRVTFSVRGNTITFPGFLRAYVEGSDDPAAELEDREKHLPPMAEGDALDGRSFEPKSHTTQPPARFTEASLVRRLEELGVGRPSTYASILSTIQDRGYVWKKGSALVPSFKAFAVVTLLERHFGSLVDYEFTARMEDDLDAIARGATRTVPWLRRFYFGGNGPQAANENADPATAAPQVASAPHNALEEDARPDDEGRVSLDVGLAALVSSQLETIDAREINSLPLGEDDQGRQILVRVGRYGPYLERGDDRVGLPEDLPPDELTVAKATELLDTSNQDKELGRDPESGVPVYLKTGRFGTYVQLGEQQEGSKEKPKRASILSYHDPAALGLDDALALLSLPREVGVDPKDGEKVTVHNGRFGPYLQKGSERRSLDSDEKIFRIGLEEALGVLAQPKRGRGQAAAPPLKELGDDPVSGKPVTVRKGRYGPYVSDGDTHASLRTGDLPESMTLERAAELLQARRERGPSKKKAASKRKTGTKKKTATKKKAASKKKKRASTSKAGTTKKTATKKKAASKKKKKAGSKAAGSAKKKAASDG